MMKLRQFMCVHWFDAPVVLNYSESYGAIVCCEQKTDTVTIERRTCSKCGLTDRREIGRAYEGWS